MLNGRPPHFDDILVVELSQCNGRAIGVVTSITRFPFSIGRKDADLIIAEPGVWDRHLVIEQALDGRFVAVPQNQAQVSIAGAPIAVATPLRNGDLLDLGAARIQFRVSPTRQRSLAAVESMVWLGLGALAAGQFALALSW